MLDEKLLNKNYYLNAMSKFLLNSYGVSERYDVYLKILYNLDEIAEDIFSRFDIYNSADWEEKDYFIRNNIDRTATEDKWLDIIASIYNINRTMQISYTDPTTSPDPTDVTETITLNNWELYIYIKVMVSKLNFNGTAKEIVDLYGTGGVGSDDLSITYLGINYIWQNSNSTYPLSCQVIFYNNELINAFKNHTTNQNICKLFLSGNLLIESLGITYEKFLSSKLASARFDIAEFYDSSQQTIYTFC